MPPPDARFQIRATGPRSPSNGSVSGNGTLGTRHRARFISNDPGPDGYAPTTFNPWPSLTLSMPDACWKDRIAGLRSNQSAVFASNSEPSFTLSYFEYLVGVSNGSACSSHKEYLSKYALTVFLIGLPKRCAFGFSD